jgi:hypothetical protein
MNIEQLESFNLADAVKFHDKLNPLLWDERENLHPEIHEQLMKIVADFSEFLGVKDLDLKDVTISGSNAAFSYTAHSDIDLHLIVDLSNVEHQDIYRELFDAKKAIYNSEHNITIKGIPVELYVQDANQDHHSQGIYSILNNDWLQIPRRVQTDIDDMSVRSKYDDISQRISRVIKSKDLTKMNELSSKIKHMRTVGLAEHGEFGVENLVFKMLRNKGDIGKLQTARHDAKSVELSLKERERKPYTTYGYGRDFVDEVALTPGGVSDQTHMFCEKELEETDSTPAISDKSIIEDFVDFCYTQLGLEKEINLRIRRDPQWSVRNKTFGRYDENTNELNVGVGGRHIMDILRTVAHEMVHQRQNETQEMPADAGMDGSEYENEANAQAGVLMRKYGKLHPELFSADTELDEYLAHITPYGASAGGLGTKGSIKATAGGMGTIGPYGAVAENHSNLPTKQKSKVAIPFNQTVNELSVNRNNTVHQWQLRNDNNFGFIKEVPNIILKNVKVVIDQDSYDNGKQIFAYLQGDQTNDIPEDMYKFPIKYQRNSAYPFIDKSTGEPIENIDYVKFDDQGKVTGFKQAEMEGVAGSSHRVTAHGYAYNRQDQRVAWTKEFTSEAEAKEWARRRNATVLSIVPKEEVAEAQDWQGI